MRLNIVKSSQEPVATIWSRSQTWYDIIHWWWTQIRSLKRSIIREGIMWNHSLMIRDRDRSLKYLTSAPHQQHWLPQKISLRSEISECNIYTGKYWNHFEKCITIQMRSWNIISYTIYKLCTLTYMKGNLIQTTFQRR